MEQLPRAMRGSKHSLVKEDRGRERQLIPYMGGHIVCSILLRVYIGKRYIEEGAMGPHLSQLLV